MEESSRRINAQLQQVRLDRQRQRQDAEDAAAADNTGTEGPAADGNADSGVGTAAERAAASAQDQKAEAELRALKGQQCSLSAQLQVGDCLRGQCSLSAQLQVGECLRGQWMVPSVPGRGWSLTDWLAADDARVMVGLVAWVCVQRLQASV